MSNIWYNKTHTITFGDKNTWTDWHLVPSTRPVILPPSVKTSYATLLGSDNQVDCTEAVAGRPTYDYRTGSLEFYVDNDWEPWYEVYSKVMDYLHGQDMKAYLSDDKYYYYTGRYSVNTWRSDSVNSMITIDYNVYPYKMELWTSVGDWLWDPFSFIDGVIRQYKNISVQGDKDFNIIGSRMPVTPEVRAKVYRGDSITMEVDGVIYELKNGKNEVDLVITEGEHRVLLSGYGTVTLKYRGGRL